MNKRVIKGWRKFTTEEHVGRDKALAYDFTALIQAMKAWA